MPSNVYIYGLYENIKVLVKLINQIQSDLEQSKNSTNKYSYFKQQQIKILTNVVNELGALMDTLQWDKNNKEHADDKIFKLEGICLLHGISDIEYYYSFPTMYVANLVKEAYAENWRQTPVDLLPNNKIDLIKNPKIAQKPILDWSTYKK